MDTNNSEYLAFSSEFIAGEGMTIATPDMSIEDLRAWVFTDKALWFYDGIRYRVVIQFEEKENGAVLYFFDDDGKIVSQEYSE